MDNNNPIEPPVTPNPAPAAAPQMPVTPQQIPVNPPSAAASSVIASSEAPKSGGGAKKIMMILVILILVVAGLGGGYLYMNSQNNTETAEVPAQEQSYDDLESEIDGVDVGSVDSDFAEVDKDLQSL